jgi:hypothetical protein
MGMHTKHKYIHITLQQFMIWCDVKYSASVLVCVHVQKFCRHFNTQPNQVEI